MAELEIRLRAIGAAAFPPAPELAEAVGVRLRAGETARPRRFTRGRAVALAFAALLVPAAAVAAVPDTRHSVLDWLGLRHVRVERVRHLPKLPGLKEADLGTHVGSVSEASDRAGFAVRVPAALGRPRAIYAAGGGIVSLVYDEVLVTELRALQEPELIKKALVAGTTVEPVSIDGTDGFFFSGAPHEVLFAPRDGGPIRPLPPRLAGNTLAFERRGLVVRIEGRSLTKKRALELARSLSL